MWCTKHYSQHFSLNNQYDLFKNSKSSASSNDKQEHVENLAINVCRECCILIKL